MTDRPFVTCLWFDTEAEAAADFYTGPLARALGGVDLSWMVGIAVVSPVYYFAVRAQQRPLPAGAR